MVKLPTMPPPGARISTLTVATPTTSLACVETVTVPPSSTGSGASAVLLKDGDVVSRTTTLPEANAAVAEESSAQVRYDRGRAVGDAGLTSYAPRAELKVMVKFAGRAAEGS